MGDASLWWKGHILSSISKVEMCALIIPDVILCLHYNGLQFWYMQQSGK
jgi:hypothetical protein